MHVIPPPLRWILILLLPSTSSSLSLPSRRTLLIITALSPFPSRSSISYAAAESSSSEEEEVGRKKNNYYDDFKRRKYDLKRENDGGGAQAYDYTYKNPSGRSSRRRLPFYGGNGKSYDVKDVKFEGTEEGSSIVEGRRLDRYRVVNPVRIWWGNGRVRGKGEDDV